MDSSSVLEIHLDFDFNDPILQAILDQEGLNLNLDQDKTNSKDTAQEPLKAPSNYDQNQNDNNVKNDDNLNVEVILDQEHLHQYSDQDKTSAKDTGQDAFKAVKNENGDDTLTEEELTNVFKEVDEFLAELESKPTDNKSVMEYINSCKDKAGLSDDDLMKLGVKELNGKLKDTNLEKREKHVIKQWYIILYSASNINRSNIFTNYISRRRKIKNRGYAMYCRNQREGQRTRSLEIMSVEEIIVKKYEVGT